MNPLSGIKRYFNRLSLANRLLCLILGFGLVFAIAETALQLYLDFRADIAQIETQINRVETNYLKSISKSTWNMDADQVVLQLEGALNARDIVFLEVVTETGETLASAGDRPLDFQKIITRELPLVHRQHGKTHAIGLFRVTASLAGIYDRLFATIKMIMITRLFITFALSGIFLFVFRQLISRHLTTMALYAQKLDFHEKGTPLVLKRRPSEPSAPDELEKVVTAMNQMRFHIQVYIDEIRSAQEALRKEKEFTETALNFQQDTFFLFEPDTGRAVRWNRAFTEISGYSDEEVAVLPAPVSYYSPDDLARASEFITGVFEKGSGTIELELITKPGRKIPFEYNVSVFENEQGGPKYMISIGRDISRQKQAEQERLRAERRAAEQEKLAIVGQIAGKMAHDFNNILGVIMGNAELARLDAEGERLERIIEIIYGQTVRGRNMTRNLIAFAKDQELKQEFFKIKEKIDLVLDLMKKDLTGIEVVRRDQDEMPGLLADPGMIEHALVNLIQNAIHAISKTKDPRIVVRTSSNDREIFLEIEDNGCGIPKVHLKDIFSPSFTLKGSRDRSGAYQKGIKGTGYGMSNVKKYIEQHRGEIRVESEPGMGTIFRITLPVTLRELTTEEKSRIAAKKTFTGKNILLVEDEPAISDIQHNVLTSSPFNHKVDIVENGEAALKLFKPGRYDLISLDYVLRNGITGMEVYNRIRELDPGVPILFISGNIEFLESIRDLKHKDTLVEHLSKPCRNKDYVDCINRLLERVLQ